MAVLVADVADAHRLGHLDGEAEALLAGNRAPIVLAPDGPEVPWPPASPPTRTCSASSCRPPPCTTC